MIKFKIRSYGTGRRSSKAWLNDACQQLPNIFSFSDIKFSGCFPVSVTNKISRAKKHGSKITLRKGRGYHVYIQVINKEDGKKQKKDLTSMKRLATKLSKSKDVQLYFDTVRKIKATDCRYEPPLK